MGAIKKKKRNMISKDFTYVFKFQEIMTSPSVTMLLNMIASTVRDLFCVSMALARFIDLDSTTALHYIVINNTGSEVRKTGV